LNGVPPDNLFRLLVHSVRDYAIFLLDPGGRVASWNVGAARLKGWSTDEIVGKHFSIFYPDLNGDRDAICAAELEEATSSGRFADEGWRVRKDGSRFWASVIITALRDESGSLVGFAKITRDLTERRRAQIQRVRLAEAEDASRRKDEHLAREKAARDTVEEARNSLATALESIGDAVIAADAAGNVTIMNPVAEKLTGWPLDEARGRPLRAVFHIINEDTGRVVESPVDRVLREGVAVGLGNHILLISRDGAETPIHDSAAPIRNGEGHVRGIVLVFRDASAEARESARRAFIAEATSLLGASLDYRETFVRVADVFVPRFADWCMVYGFEEGDPAPVCLGTSHVERMKSELVRQLSAIAPSPVSIRGVADVLHTGRLEHHPFVTDAMLADWVSDPGRLRIVRQLRIASMLIVPLTAGHRISGAAVLAYSDSTRRYDADDVDFIEEIGRRAGSAIENARLYAMEQRARSLADAASRMKDEFLATVSHELRTPLTAILGWGAMLARPETPHEKKARALDTVLRNAKSMSQLIEELLDVSRIVSGKIRIEFGAVDLPIVLHGAVEAVRPAAETRQVRLVQVVDPDLPVIRGDATRLQQVIGNLLSNAVKFTPRDGTVSVRVSRVDSQVEIVVRDSGVGIDARFLPHVFEPFRQADASITRASGGLGLGLAIVKNIIERHGGRVEAASEGQGHGSTFTVRLPLARASQAPREAPDGAGPPACAGELALTARLDGVRVLIVDDDVDTRDLLVETLLPTGAEVTGASSVAEAMAEFARRPPNVLVSDIGMPGESGLDLIKRVRALPRDSGGFVPAAALTSYAREEDRRSALAAGFQLHIPKPIDPIELSVLVATLARLRID
jgi:PAS domain S-box-containing protein